MGQENGDYPVCCILPPHVLRRMSEKGSADIRNAAFDTLRISERLRGLRQAVADSQLAAPTGGLRRTIYDAKNKERLPGALVRSEGAGRSGDAATDEAYDGLGSTYTFYDEVCRRKSIDGNGLRLDATVHYGKKYMNAFWDGRQMVFGDGDGEIFGAFTKCLDVIGHELTHGVVQYEAGLVYWDEPGALNESMADVFGTLVKQLGLKQRVDQADWMIGRGLLVKFPDQALRSMKAPGTAYDNELMGKDPQPSHYKDYDPDKYPEDNGGVHVFSGIPNHAFYRASMSFGGNAWEKAGRIWYHALTELLGRRSTFADAALATITAAGRLFDASAEKVVREAWEVVGVKSAQLKVA
ncbi:MAG: peptidase M4 [Anaeromyxobacter sp. RBG_16_69_14]|nr:MAG: peptidase M4 [Anaeromyxobacter sp. RBG_16_69_14]